MLKVLEKSKAIALLIDTKKAINNKYDRVIFDMVTLMLGG